MRKSYLISGASGFIGSALIPALVGRGLDVGALSRSGTHGCTADASIKWVLWSGKNAVDVQPALRSVDVLIHLAGRAHVVTKPSAASNELLREANVRYTERLARAAASSGVRRLVYVSSLAVYGSALKLGSPILETTAVNPIDAYGRTKLEAEERLRYIASEAEMELVIVRPALVVGAGAPGNLERLANLVRGGVPIPVPFQDNQRSFVTLNNLVNLLISCAQRDAAVGQVFVAAEKEYPSTTSVLKWIGEGMGRRVRTVKVPGALLRASLSIAGKANLYDKVFGDLRVDSGKARQLLGWDQTDRLDDAFRHLGSRYVE